MTINQNDIQEALEAIQQGIPLEDDETRKQHFKFVGGRLVSALLFYEGDDYAKTLTGLHNRIEELVRNTVEKNQLKEVHLKSLRICDALVEGVKAAWEPKILSHNKWMTADHVREFAESVGIKADKTVSGIRMSRIQGEKEA